MKQQRARTPNEIKQLVNESLQRLRNMAARYDARDENEAKAIANALHQLLFDPTPGDRPSRTQSLLTQRGDKASIAFLDTSWSTTETHTSYRHAQLTGSGRGLVSFDGANRAPLGERGISKTVAFDSWWNEGLSFFAADGTEISGFSRAKIIRAMRDRDGGAHTDAEVDENYARATDWGWGFDFHVIDTVPGQDYDIYRPKLKNAVAAAVRQIAFEVLESVDEEEVDDDFADLFDDPEPSSG